MVFLVGILSSGSVAFANWHQNNPLIAHALGSVDGKIETNSKEAFISSWENGYQVLEADFEYTSDGILVIRHDFDEDGSYYRLEQEIIGSAIMDSNTYTNSKIIYEQTPMTAKDLLSLMVEYPDIYIVTDTKSIEEEIVVKQFSDLIEIAQEIGHIEVLNRIIPQIYHEEMYGWINEIYDFEHWIYTLYMNLNPNYPEIISFCKKNGIETITIPKERVTQDLVSQFQRNGIYIYVHTINRYKEFDELLDIGVNGIYTDRIMPYELEWMGMVGGRQIKEGSYEIQGENYNMSTLEILGKNYVPLREFATIGEGFSANFQHQQNTLALTSGETFVSLGNEMFLGKENHLIMEKAPFIITFDGRKAIFETVLVDNEIFVPVKEMSILMN